MLQCDEHRGNVRDIAPCNNVLSVVKSGDISTVISLIHFLWGLDCGYFNLLELKILPLIPLWTGLLHFALLNFAINHFTSFETVPTYFGGLGHLQHPLSHPPLCSRAQLAVKFPHVHRCDTTCRQFHCGILKICLLNGSNALGTYTIVIFT